MGDGTGITLVKTNYREIDRMVAILVTEFD